MDDDSRIEDSRIKDIIYKRKNDYDIVNDPESIASCKREQNRDVIDNSRLGSYDKYGNYVIIPEIKRELISMPKLIYNQYSSNGIKVYELKSTIPIFNDVYLKLVISGDMANLILCEQVNREAGGYLEVYDEVIDSTAMGLEERLPISIVFRNYNIFENPNDFGKELKDSKFDNILTRKVYLGLLSKELKSVSTLDEKEAFKKMVSTLKQSGEYGQKVLNEFLGRLKDRPAIFEISKAENYNKAMNEVLLSSLEIATTEQDKQDSETRQTYLEVLNTRDQNIEEDLHRANDRVSEEYVKHIVDKAKTDFVNEQLSEEELSASDEFYAKINADKTITRRRTLDKPILKQGKENAQEITATTKEERIKQILAQKEKSAKKTPAGKKLKASKGKKPVKKLKAGAKKKVAKKPVKKRVKPKKAKVKSKKKVKKAKPKKKAPKKKSAKKKVKRKLAKRNLKAKKGKIKSKKKKKVKKPKNAKKAKNKAGSLKPKKQGGAQKFKTSAPKKAAKKKAGPNLALQANLYERAMDIDSRATLNYSVNISNGAKVYQKPVTPTKTEQREESFSFDKIKMTNTSLKEVEKIEPQNTNPENMPEENVGATVRDRIRTIATVAQSPNVQQVPNSSAGVFSVSSQTDKQAGKEEFSHSTQIHSPSSEASQSTSAHSQEFSQMQKEFLSGDKKIQGSSTVEKIVENIIIEKTDKSAASEEQLSQDPTLNVSSQAQPLESTTPEVTPPIENILEEEEEEVLPPEEVPATEEVAVPEDIPTPEDNPDLDPELNLPLDHDKAPEPSLDPTQIQ